MISLKSKLKEIQKALGTKADGILGEHTTDVLYRQFAKPKLPYEGHFFGCDVIIGDPEKTNPFNSRGRNNTGDFAFTMSGTFTYPSGVNPISIMVSKGIVIYNASCRIWAGYPETVLYYTKDGKFGKKLCKTASELPDNVLWAIGGGDMKPLKPLEEGFCRFTHNGIVYDHSDVYRRTSHNCIGYDQFGNVIGVYHHNDTITGMQTRCDNIGLVDVIFLDGGHISSINAGTIRRNVNQKQGSMIQF